MCVYVCVQVCVGVYLLGGAAVCVQAVCAVQFTLSLAVEQRHMVAGRLCCTRCERKSSSVDEFLHHKPKILQSYRSDR